MLYGFFTLSASIALAIALTQLVAAIAKAPNALPLEGTLQVFEVVCIMSSLKQSINATLGIRDGKISLILQGIAIDAGAIVVLLLLFRSDWKVLSYPKTSKPASFVLYELQCLRC